MTRLVVKDFSCIEHADIELANFTILIGPQASGKSLISKLIYFFQEIILKQHQYIQEFHPISEFKNELDEKFRKWFPYEAWGNKRFTIKFEIGLFSAEIIRPSIAATKSGKLSISFSDFFIAEYNTLLETVNKDVKEKIRKRTGVELDPRRNFELFWKIRQVLETKYAKALGKNAFTRQIFIPAGRSFFTSLGKAIAIFEQGGIIDPVTVDFGRLFASLRDSRYYGPFFFEKGAIDVRYPKEIKKKLFGGDIERQRENDYLLTEDGRRIPLAYLSSGQQELFPLWIVLEYLGHLNTKEHEAILFIEEPEAHLFPSAQSTLIEYITSLTAEKHSPARTVITTHSPYILAQVNNFLKAGMVSKKLGTSAHDKINKIVPKAAWLKPGSTVAYAMDEGKTVSIMDEEGLIDATYIDRISSDIMDQFSVLIDLEYSYAKK